MFDARFPRREATKSDKLMSKSDIRRWRFAHGEGNVIPVSSVANHLNSTSYENSFAPFRSCALRGFFLRLLHGPGANALLGYERADGRKHKYPFHLE